MLRPLAFPEETLLTRNFFTASWSLQPRRLKNVIVILEWQTPPIAPPSSAPMFTSGPAMLDENGKRAVESAFRALDLDGSGHLEDDEAARLLDILDIEDRDGLDRYRDRNGTFDLTGLQNAVAAMDVIPREKQRNFIAVTLAEAEALRAFSHVAKSSEQDFPAMRLLGLARWAVDLEGGKGGRISTLASTPTFFTGASKKQYRLCAATLQFVDIELDPDRTAVRLLQHGVPSPSAERRLWWEAVRSCRRRKRRGWERTPLYPLFADDKDVDQSLSSATKVEAYATLARLAANLASRGLSPYDAFDAFDHDSDGTLTPAELAGGLRWLLKSARPAEVLALARYLDADHDGFVSREEFEAALQPMLQQFPATPSTDNEPLEGNPTPDFETFGGSEVRPEYQRAPSVGALKNACVSVETLPRFHLEWDSRGALSTTGRQVSLWSPKLSTGPLTRSICRVNLGCYASGHLSPPLGKASVLEFRDKSAALLFDRRASTVDELPKVVDFCCPKPTVFHRAFEIVSHGRKQLFVWKPEPPSDDFVALGLAVTTAPDPPSALDDGVVRCVPRAWTRESETQPKLLFDTVGLQGKNGGLWRSSLGLLAVGANREPPKDILELKPLLRPSDAPGATAVDTSFTSRSTAL